ncbi:MAG: hypothetical protein K2Z80_02135 [Xanthobacteraceae bacterium]|nr:hypothetical protein [Xanthobacteraceae bacterium]
MMTKPPDFWEAFAAALQLSAAERSWRAFFPWWLIICCAIPPAVVFSLGLVSSAQTGDDGAITILSAIAVVAGFFGSVSIASLAQVQRMVSEYPFSSYLKDEGQFDQFLFWPQYTLMLQIGLLLASALAAISVRLVAFNSWNKYLISLDLGLLIYVCTKTWNLVDLVRKLTWYYEDYNRQFKEYQAQQSRKG